MIIRSTSKSIYYPTSEKHGNLIHGSKRIRYIRAALVIRRRSSAVRRRALAAADEYRQFVLKAAQLHFYLDGVLLKLFRKPLFGDWP